MQDAQNPAIDSLRWITYAHDMKLLQRNYVKYGLILASLMIPCLIYLELSGTDFLDVKSPVLLIYQFIAPAVVWYFGLQAHKKKQGGKMTFKQGLAEGFRMSVVFAAISPFISLVYYLWVNPEILVSVKEIYQMPNASDAQIITSDMFSQFFGGVTLGTIYASILSLFLKTKKA